MALHYTGCGLPNVWLKSGFKAHETKYGVAYSYDDIDGLYGAITVRLCASQRGFTPDVLRFLRKRLGYSQSELGAALGYTSQAVAKWEKGISHIPLAVTQLVRLWCLNKFSPRTLLRDALEKNITLSTEPLEFEYLNSKWEVAQVIPVRTTVQIKDTTYTHQIQCVPTYSHMLAQWGFQSPASDKGIHTTDLGFTAFSIPQEIEEILSVSAGAGGVLDTHGYPSISQHRRTTTASPVAPRRIILDKNTVPHGVC